ncbi:hypothetical protein Bhyg_01481 [Pseudolycoriella hygida]|uniref:Uncharacterized protein n=1 Tax=Pseudolycoriella hygida TaxID=35572 RepID=A0A9Q0S7L5_9DIPT|nr:hypothetical protein Bhyg_01481 [Pseudolycoriella hygida]
MTSGESADSPLVMKGADKSDIPKASIGNIYVNEALDSANEDEMLPLEIEAPATDPDPNSGITCGAMTYPK